MVRHPLELLRIIFVALVCVMVIAALTTKARPRTPWQWTLVWAVLVFLAWALLGFGWLRASAGAPRQHEVDHIQPAADAVQDGPKNRVPLAPGNRDRERTAERNPCRRRGFGPHVWRLPAWSFAGPIARLRRLSQRSLG